MFGLDLFFRQYKNPLIVNLENVEKTLNGLFVQFVDYFEMQIKLN